MPGATLPCLRAANAGWQQVKLTPGSPAGQRRWQIDAGGSGQGPLEWLEAGMAKSGCGGGSTRRSKLRCCVPLAVMPWGVRPGHREAARSWAELRGGRREASGNVTLYLLRRVQKQERQTPSPLQRDRSATFSPCIAFICCLGCSSVPDNAFKPISEHAQPFPDSGTVQPSTKWLRCASVPLSLTLVVPVCS